MDYFMVVMGKTDCREKGKPNPMYDGDPDYLEGFRQQYALEQEQTAKQEQSNVS